MSLTRRQFLKRSGLATGGLLGANVLGHVLARPAFADLLGPLDRYLVVLYLDGGNDGLNTIVPFDDVGGANLRSHYETHRGGGGGGTRLLQGQLVVPSRAMLDPGSGTQLGFHPALAELATLYDQGQVAVIQGCGYPDYNLSHDESTTIWATGNPLGLGALGGTGIVGRHLAAEYGAPDIPAVIIRNGPVDDFRQTATNVLSLSNLDDFEFPYDGYDSSDDAAKDLAYQTLFGNGFGGHALSGYVANTGTAAFQAVQDFAPLHDDYVTDRAAFNAQYEGGGRLARSFREVAKLIYGVEQGAPGIATRFFHLREGGFDTHSNQGGTNGSHAQHLNQVSRALGLFYEDLDDMGAADKVVTIVWSEFSRRIPQNKNGTDHGSQGPMLVIGGNAAGTGPVQAGVYGNHPNIDPLALDNRENTPYSQAPADAHRSTDFRDVYGTLFKHWVTVPEATILSELVQLDGGDPDLYWTSQDFDLGFF